MSAKKLAGHNDYVALETLVTTQGISVYEAAQQIGLPLGAFKSRNADRTWYEMICAKAETARASLVDQTIDRRVKSGEAGDSLTKAWAARNHPDYRERQQVEISGTIQHEAKIVSLGDLVQVMKESKGFEDELRELEGSGRALPSPPRLLPAPAEPEAGDVPADGQA